MKEEDKSKLVEGINLERRDGSKHCPARDSSRCSSTRQ